MFAARSYPPPAVSPRLAFAASPSASRTRAPTSSHATDPPTCARSAFVHPLPLRIRRPPVPPPRTQRAPSTWSPVSPPCACTAGRPIPSTSAGAGVPATPTEPRAPSLAERITNLFPLWVTVVSTLALLRPAALAWFKLSYTVPTLIFVMLGVGLTISPSSFLAVTRAPKRVLVGVLAQYTLMPALSTLVARALALPPALAAGVILVGVCPGGAASNVVCMLAGADVALSVVLTLISTLCSVALIPSLMYLLAGTLVPVSARALLLSTLQVVLAPLVLGAVLKRLFPRTVDALSSVLPLCSMAAVVAICGAVVSANAAALLSIGPRVIAAIAAMHALGGLTGYLAAALAGFPVGARRTLSVEVMMQNSTLAVSLANAHFANPLTAVPGAISATMHSIFGSVLAGFWRLRDARSQARQRAQPPP